jgi:hypothetical protein
MTTLFCRLHQTHLMYYLYCVLTAIETYERWILDPRNGCQRGSASSPCLLSRKKGAPTFPAPFFETLSWPLAFPLLDEEALPTEYFMKHNTKQLWMVLATHAALDRGLGSQVVAARHLRLYLSLLCQTKSAPGGSTVIYKLNGKLRQTKEPTNHIKTKMRFDP